MTGKLRVFIADDHSVVREGLKALISGQNDMTVVGEAADGQSALAAARRVRPDVAVIDVSMPDLNGAAVTQQLKREQPDLRVTMLTVQQDRAYVRQAFAAGATGYVLKLAKPTEVLQAIRLVAAGGVYVDPAIGQRTKGLPLDPTEIGCERERPILSAREIELLQLIARGYTNKEIGDRMDITVKTTEKYKARVMDKLGFRSRVQIIQLAIHQGWLKAADAG